MNKRNYFGENQQKENERIVDKLKNRLGHIRRKMSRGASNMYRIIRTRCKWGNKELWGSREKGRGNPKPK